MSITKELGNSKEKNKEGKEKKNNNKVPKSTRETLK